MSASGPYVCEECRKLDQNWYNPCPHWRIVKSERAKARREALEDAIQKFEGEISGIKDFVRKQSDFYMQYEDQGSSSRRISTLEGCIAELRALMEKDAPERPTSDELDPAGLEAACQQFRVAAERAATACRDSHCGGFEIHRDAKCSDCEEIGLPTQDECRACKAARGGNP